MAVVPSKDRNGLAEAASLSAAPIPFCGGMTRGWNAFNITQRLPANPIVLKLGRALGGSRGLDLEAVRPACDLRGCGREAARAAWSLHPALREATAHLRRNVKQSIVCAHVRTGRGETSTDLSFLAHAVAALVALGQSVLLCSDTHSALDNVLLKLRDRPVEQLI